MKLEQGMAAVVTGGASGLGKASAQALADAGLKVTIFDVNDEAGEAHAKAIGGTFAHVDITDEQAVVDGFAKARSADCVAVAGSNANATEYDARALEDMIDAVVSASASLSASIDPASCPATLDGADDFR